MGRPGTNGSNGNGRGPVQTAPTRPPEWEIAPRYPIPNPPDEDPEDDDDLDEEEDGDPEDGELAGGRTATTTAPESGLPPIFPSISNEQLRWHLRRTAHMTALHAVRVPVYVLRTLRWAPIGIGRATVKLWRWETNKLGRDHLDWAPTSEEYLKLKKDHRETIHDRLVPTVLAGCVIAAALMVGYYNWPAHTLAVIGGVVWLAAWYGAPKGSIIEHIEPAAPELRKWDVGVIRKAFEKAGLSKGPDKDGFDADPDDRMMFLTDPARDGDHGTSCRVALPLGTTASKVFKAKAALASGLRVGKMQLFITPDRDNENELELYIADRDPYRGEPVPTPLLDIEKLDFWEGFPFGVDQRGREVWISMLWTHMLVGSIPRFGKALAVDTPVPTPDGWTTMGAIKAGDKVFDDTGNPCTVTHAWPVRHDRQCYEVEFSDGTTVVADAEHLWEVETGSTRRNRTPAKVMTTGDMAVRVRIEADNRTNYSVRVAGALQGDDVELPIPPYTLGAWLGDGNSVDGYITSADPEIIANIEAEGESVLDTGKRCGKASYYRVVGLTTRLRLNELKQNKHIPVAYLRASETQRRALLAGLLDTDGWAQNGAVCIGQKSERIARGIFHLVASLGYKPSLTWKRVFLDGNACGLSWIVTFTTPEPAFRLDRKVQGQSQYGKASNKRRFITAIHPVPSVPVRCITVDSPSRLYLVTSACIPTHNTQAARLVACAAALDPNVRLLVYNGKGDGAWGAFEKVAHRYGNGVPDDVVDDLIATLEQLEQDMHARMAKLTELRYRIPESKITREIANDPNLDMPLTLLVIDEMQVYASDKKPVKNGPLGRKLTRGDYIMEMLTNIARVAPSAGIMLLLATQRPDSVTSKLLTSLRDNMGTRVCFRMMSPDPAKMVLGVPPPGKSPTQFQEGHEGVAVLVGGSDADSGATDAGRIIRTHFGDDDMVEAIIDGAWRLREKLGTLTGYAAGETPGEKTPDRLLDHILETTLKNEDRLAPAVVLDRLQVEHPEIYSGWSEDRLRQCLRDAGVDTSHQINRTNPKKGERKNVRGMKIDEVKEALARKLAGAGSNGNGSNGNTDH